MRIRANLTDYNVLFWNCNGKDDSSDFQDCLCEIVKENDVKIIGLCECKCDYSKMANKLRNINPNFEFIGQSELLGVGKKNNWLYSRFFMFISRIIYNGKKNKPFSIIHFSK